MYVKSIHGEPVCKVFRLFATADELYDRVEHLAGFTTSLLLLKNKHEMMTETRLHHHPVNGAD